MKYFRRTWSLEEQGTFLLRLGKLLDKGYPLSQAIEFLGIQQSPLQRFDLQKCLINLRSGLPLHESLKSLHFPHVALGYLYFAEKNGNLASGLCEAGNMILLKVRYTRRFKKLSSYPLILLIFVVTMITFIQQILFPQLLNFSSSAYIEASQATSWLVRFLSFIPNLFLLLLLLIIIAMIMYFYWFKKLPYDVQMNIFLKIPLWRQLIVSYQSQLFAFQLSNLLYGGLSIYESLQVLESQENMPFLQIEARHVKLRLVKGEKLDSIIESRNHFEKELALVIRHGQSNGELAKELAHYTEFVLLRIEQKLEKWLRVIQPLLFSLVGVLVILMYLAILLPMFQMLNQL